MLEMDLKTITQAVQGQLLGENASICGVSTDTRTIQQGELFIALTGERFDGHAYIETAFKKGAAGAITERESAQRPLILVSSAGKALMDLAAYYRSLFPAKVVGITGSVGKTTTKDMTAAVLEQKYKVLKNTGNFNNEIGLPLTVFRLSKETEIAVLEMGMNHFGEIHNLSKIAKPSIAVINNIGVAHLENLGSQDGILKAKMEITDFLAADGLLIVNGDDEKLSTVIGNGNYSVQYFGIRNQSGLYASDITEKDGKTCFTIHYKQTAFSVKLKTMGRHMVLNAAAAAAVGFALGLEADAIQKGLESFEPPHMRMEILRSGRGFQIINDCYNANPDSMKAAVDTLGKCGGRKAAILGDMFELGEQSGQMHYEVGSYAVQNGIDLIITIGENAKALYDGAKKAKSLTQQVVCFSTKDEFYQHLDLLDGFDYVLIKASRLMKFEEIALKLQA